MQILPSFFSKFRAKFTLNIAHSFHCRRNDVNHSGYLPSPKIPEELKEGLSRVYANIKAAFKL